MPITCAAQHAPFVGHLLPIVPAPNLAVSANPTAKRQPQRAI